MNKSKFLVTAAMTSFLAACSSETDETTNNANVRVWHASPDAPLVNVYVNSEKILSDIDYRDVTSWLALPEGSHQLMVKGITPAGEVTVIDTEINLMADYQYEVAAVNTTASISAAVISKMAGVPAENNVQVQVAHLAPNAPTVDVHVTAPDAALSGTTVVTTLAFGENSDELEVPAGDYQIRITPTNDATTVVYDSGTVNLEAGKELFISALQNTDANSDQLVSLAVSDGTASFNLYDEDQGVDLTVVHASADTPAVDITADDFASILVTDIDYTEVQGPLNIPAATYNLDIGVTGANTSALAVDGLALANAQKYSAIALGSLTDETIEVLPLGDDNRSVATHAKVRILHGSTQAGLVDIYVTDQGDTDLSDNEPAFESVDYKTETGYVNLAEGNYTVHVALEDTTTVAIEADLDLSAGDVFTAIARDPIAPSNDFGLIVY